MRKLSQESKVVSLHGDPLPTRERNQQLVDFLKAALEQAEAGELIGMAYALEFSDQSTARGTAGARRIYPTIGALFSCICDLQEELRAP